MKVLVAEDEKYAWLAYKIALQSRNHDVIITVNGQECIDTYKKHMEIHQMLVKNKAVLASNGPFDVVLLDYRMPKKDGMEVAKEILALNPRQRIIFASAYVKETLVDSVKQLNQVVELMQKPFEMSSLIDTVEDKQIYENLQRLNINMTQIKGLNPTHEQIRDLLNGLSRIQKNRTF